VPGLRERALRGGRGARAALARVLPAAVVGVAALALAPAAIAGQIVWSTGNGIWAMRDDGSDPHELISANSPALASSLPQGTCSRRTCCRPAAARCSSSERPRPTRRALSRSPAERTARDLRAARRRADRARAGRGRRDGAAYYESQPRLTADGQELFGSSLYSGITASALPAPAAALVERPLSAGATVAEWGSTGSETEPASGFDGAPDPADPSSAVWVAAQGCSYHVPDAQESSSPRASTRSSSARPPSGSSPPVVIFDNEYVSANGGGPTSLALSSDGTMLLMVDPYAPNTGIYTTPVAGVPARSPSRRCSRSPRAGPSARRASPAQRSSLTLTSVWARPRPGHLHAPGELHRRELQLPRQRHQPDPRRGRGQLGPRLDVGERTDCRAEGRGSAARDRGERAGADDPRRCQAAPERDGLGRGHDRRARDRPPRGAGRHRCRRAACSARCASPSRPA